jgi:hypothetical protein
VVDDGVSCTDDSCDEGLDLVVNAPNDGLCDDFDPCTADSCDELLGCGHAPIPDCSPPVSSVPALPDAGRALLALLLAGAAWGGLARRRAP